MLVWDIVWIQCIFENSVLSLINRELGNVLVGVLEFGKVLEHFSDVLRVQGPF